MKELRDILAAADGLGDASYALATVVRIGGSTYRRPGARMLVGPDGRRHGTISGGCLEGEVAEQARAVLAEGRAMLQPFDLRDDDLILGFGTGCDGVVHVLVEPVPAPDRADPVALLRAPVARRTTAVLTTVIDAPAPDLLGRHVLVHAGGDPEGDALPAALAADVLRDARAELTASPAEGHTWRSHHYDTADGPVEVLFEILRPPVRLVVFGEGHDVTPLPRFAGGLGWEVHVVGRKPPAVLQERFPTADDWTLLVHPDEVGRHVAFDAWTAAVVMNHAYPRDKSLVHHLLRTDVPYVGVLGPRERTERMLEELAEAGTPVGPAARRRLYGPAGLDVGTETPEEIALAIVAEAQAVLHDRPGTPLRLRTSPIHGTRVAL